jgi:hypothetical protein
MKTRAAIVVVLFLVSSFGLASGDVPSTMTYQGRLTDPAGAPLSGDYNVQFLIYPDSVGGAPLWQEFHNSGTERVHVDLYGLFEVLLGEFVSLSPSVFAGAGSTPYLEIIINGEPLTPRKPLNSVPYAFTSTGAAGGITGSGTAGRMARFIGSTEVGDSQITDNGTNVGIGTTNPTQKLEVSGTAQVSGFKMATGASAGYVLMSDASGLGTWQPLAGGGDITGVTAGQGLTGGGGAGEVTLEVGVGLGLDRSADAISVDVTDLAGAGLGEDVSGNLIVNTGGGLETAGDAVQLTSAYSTGSSYDSRFVNEGQANSVTSQMITNGTILAEDLGFIPGGGCANLECDATHPGRIRFNHVYGTDNDIEISTTGSIAARASIVFDSNHRIEQSDGIWDLKDDILPDVDDERWIGASNLRFARAYIREVIQGHALEQVAVDGVRDDGYVLTWESGKLVMSHQARDRRVFGVSDYSAGAVRTESDAARPESCLPAISGAFVIMVTGAVAEGDLLVTSELPGHAMADSDPAPGTVIAQALEAFDGESGLIKAMIRKF